MIVNTETICLLLAQAERLFGNENGIKRRRNLLCLIHKMKRREKHERIKNGYQELVNRYLNDDFKSHFRMTRTTMDLLITQVASKLQQQNRGRVQEPVSFQCLITVWTLAGQESYRSISDRFNVTKSTVFHYLVRICNILNELGEDIIKWPDENRAGTIIEEFFKQSHFPQVLGVIDECHIDIKTPGEQGAAYINRKGRPSMVLQAVCDHRCMFVDCFVGYPGSTHDARVFSKSAISQRCSEDQSFPFNSHLLGDSAYPLGEHILVPFTNDGHLTGKQMIYNKYHASVRSVIKQAFGLLKGKWRRLIYLEMHQTNYLPIVIMAACVLHNFCILSNDDEHTIFDTDVENLMDVDANEVHHVNSNGVNKRNAIVNSL